MKCPKCNKETSITDRREYVDGNGVAYVRRKRLCANGHVSHTFETAPKNSKVSDPVKLRTGRPQTGEIVDGKRTRLKARAKRKNAKVTPKETALPSSEWARKILERL
jgi:hypothetical protein